MCRNSLVLFACLSASSAYAEVHTQLSSQYILADETVTLTLEIDQKTTEAPDLSPLHDNFSVLSRQRTQIARHSNGLADYSTRWSILLAPRNNGSLTIPPLNFLDQQSSVQTLQVTGQVSANYNDDYLMRVNLDKNEVYQNSQIIYTMQLFHRQPLSSEAHFSDPALKNGLVEPLSEQRTYEIERQGEIFSVLEQSYAIFPQETGPGLIRGPVLRDVHNGKLIEVAATDRLIETLPAAFNTANGNWLPAQNISIEDQWKPTSGGLVRTLTLNATGVPASQLPVMMPPRLAGADITLQNVELSQTSTAAGLVSQRVEHLLISPLEAASLTLPAIDIAWWNTLTDQGENSFIPEKTFDAVNTAQPANAAPATSPNTRTPEAEPATSSDQALLIRWLAGFSFFSALGWLATAFELWRLRRRQNGRISKTVKKSASPSNNTAAHSTETTEQQPDQFRVLAEQNLFASLEKACQSNDPAQTYTGLLEWAQVFWPEHGVQSVQQIGDAANSKTLHFLILDLESHITEPHEDAWQGDLLIEALDKVRKRHLVSAAELYQTPASDVVEEEVDSATLFGNAAQRL